MGEFVGQLTVAAQYWRISDIEIVWTLIASVGFVFSIYNFQDALGDYRAASTIMNGRREVAILGLKMELCRMVIQAIFILIGLAAMTIADPPDQLARPWNLTLLSILFRWGMVISALLVLYMSYSNFRVRRILLHLPI